MQETWLLETSSDMVELKRKNIPPIITAMDWMLSNSNVAGITGSLMEHDGNIWKHELLTFRPNEPEENIEKPAENKRKPGEHITLGHGQFQQNTRRN